MKFLTAFFLCATQAFSFTGYTCKNSNKIIERTNESILGKEDHRIIYRNDRIHLPDGDGTDEFQHRYGVYHQLVVLAHQNISYMPESLMIYHMIRSDKLYKKGFQAFEGKKAPVKLPKMYCDMLFKAIESY
jgi:hypothetical protein